VIPKNGVLDQSLGITQNLIIAADTVHESQSQVINENNHTVLDIKSSIMANLELDTTDLRAFKDVDVHKVKEVLGDSMVQSVNAFFITARVLR